MAGLFSSISSAFSGGDARFVDQIEQFASVYLSTGDVPHGLSLQRDEQALLAALLSEELYRRYCESETKRECDPRAIERLSGKRQARESALKASAQTVEHLESALIAVAVDLSELARRRGKFTQRFASADGLSETLVQPIISTHASNVRGARRERTAQPPPT
jgi:hypothetical protein